MMRDNHWQNMIYDFAEFYAENDDDEYFRPDIHFLAESFIEQQEAKMALLEIIDEYGLKRFKEWAEQAEAEWIAGKVL